MIKICITSDLLLMISEHVISKLKRISYRGTKDQKNIFQKTDFREDQIIRNIIF